MNKLAVDLEALGRRADVVRSRVLLSSVIGRDVKLHKAGAEHDGLCPFHDDRTLGSFKVNDRKALYKCFACGAAGDHFTYLEQRKGMRFIEALRLFESEAGIDFSDAVQKAEYDRARAKRDAAEADDAERRRKKAEGLWMFAAKLRGTPAEAYLRGRGIDFERLGHMPGALRYRHDCWCTELGRAIPAMVAAMIRDGVHVATHRTYLEYDRGQWRKARLDKAKMVLGSFAGAHIPLLKGSEARDKTLRDAPAGTIPLVSEGIENGLSAPIVMDDVTRRVIAAASLDNIGGLILPPQIGALTILGDNDRPGSAADEGLERQIARHQEAGRRVLCAWPGAGFKDFNEELMGVRMDAGAHAAKGG